MAADGDDSLVSEPRPNIRGDRKRFSYPDADESVYDEDESVSSDPAELYAEATQQREAALQFANLPVIEHLRELWEAKRISADDPVFLLVEVLGLFDERILAKDRKVLAAIEASDRFVFSALEELGARIDDFALFERKAEEVGVALAEALPHLSSSTRMAESLSDNLPQVGERLENALETLDNRSWWGFVLNWLSPAVAFSAGAALMYLLK